MIKVGDKGLNKKGLTYTVIKQVSGSPYYRYLIKFDTTGFEKEVDRNQIKTGAIFDDYDRHVYGVACKGDIKCVSSFEKKAFSNWSAMISRCYNQNDINYKSYGAKGVTVSERWLCFKDFYEDLPHVSGFDEKLYMSGEIQLDKEYFDLQNKIYCLDKCGFINQRGNLRKQPSKQTFYVATKGSKVIEFFNLAEFSKINGFRPQSITKAVTQNIPYKGWRFKIKKPINVFVSKITDWDLVLDSARMTMNKDRLYKLPSDEFKRKILLAEHSPIRTLQFMIEIKNIPCWVSQHIARHDAFAYHTVRDSFNDVHFIGTLRTDRTNIDRNNLSQDTPVNHTIYCNAQDLINISRKRLCSCASKETREVWKEVIASISEIDPILAEKCVPECLYRNFCPEVDRCCGYVYTEQYKKDLEVYRRIK